MREKIRRTDMHRAALLTAITMSALLLVSCATTEITASWRDENYQKHPRKVLIQAILKNPTNRRIVEDSFAVMFRDRGVEAVPGYTLFAGDALATPEAMKEQLHSGGFDSLLLMRLTDEKTVKQIVPGTVIHPPAPHLMAPMYDDWLGYYGGGYTAVYSPSYQVEDTYAVAETSLYDTATEKLIWSATSETQLGEAHHKLIKTYVDVMMDSLRKNKLVP